MYLRYISDLKRIFPFILALILVLSSCKVLQPHKLPDFSRDQKLFRELNTEDSSSLAEVPWDSLFTDPYLQSLIKDALENNPDLQIALARMKSAEAGLKQSRAAFFPSLSVNANASFQNQNSDGSGVTGYYQVFGNSNWEIDLWGKLRSTKRANLASFRQSEAYKRAVQTQLIADVAVTYYALLSYDAQLLITEKTLEKRNANVEAMKLMKDNDIITGADLVLSEANRYAAEVTIPDLKQQIYETENALCLLLARNPGPIDRGLLGEQAISVDLKYGVPAQMLANRPDVQEAEYRFRYYYEMTNVARSYFYPSLSITASGGFAETDLSRMLDPRVIFWNAVGGLMQPVFSQRINKQRLEVAAANEEENLISFKLTLLTAGNEVANAMHAYQAATEKIAIRTTEIEYLEKAVDYTTELLKYTSSTNYTDVLTSEVALLNAQLNSVNDKFQQMQAVVFLYKSLGGGWKQ